ASRASGAALRSSASRAAAANASDSHTRTSTRAAIVRAGETGLALTNELPNLAADHVPSPRDVVLERDAHQHDEDQETGEAGDLADAQRKRPPEDRFEGEEEQMTTIEHRNRQQIEQAEVDRDDRHRPDEIAHAFGALLTDDVVDGDGTAERRDAQATLND